MARIPLHLQALAQLKKAIAADSMEPDLTNWKQTEPLVSVDHIQTNFPVPVGRANGGNTVFRRNLDGSLDIDSAASTIIDVLQKVRHKGYLTDFEKLILSAIFPGVFSFYDPVTAAKMATVKLGASPAEMQGVALVISAHMAEELNWNGGMGGGTVPGRTFTVQ
jgi:hypothetical protein